jgi:hypothetical protein
MDVRRGLLQKVITLSYVQKKEKYSEKCSAQSIIEKREHTKEDTIMTCKIYMEDQIYYRLAEARGYNGLEHVWRAEGKIIKQVTEGRIVKKRPLGRPQIKWKDVVGKNLKMIHENVKMEDENDRIQWNEIMVLAMDIHGPLSC